MSGPLGSSQFMYSSAAAGFYSHQINKSMRFDKADSTSLKFDVTSSGDRTSWAFSTWAKIGLLPESSGNNAYRTLLGSGRSGHYDYIGFSSTDSHIYWQDFLGGSTPPYGITNAKFRDTGGWYHVVWIWDSDDSTQADRVRLYVNGNRISDYSASRALSSGDQSDINNSGRDFVIGDSAVGDSKLFDGYLAETIFIDGGTEDFTADNFGETKNGVWIPKDPSGLTFGSNGFHLKYEDTSNFGLDSSGNSNNFTVNNAGTDHQSLDTPTHSE